MKSLYAYTPPVNNGLSYLYSTQSSEGTWTNGSTNYPLASTAEVAQTLSFLGQTADPHYTSTVGWLSGQTLDTTSEIAMRMIVAPPTTADRDLLLSYFDPYGSAWGGGKFFGNNILDTALAVLALKNLNSNDPYINDVMGRGLGYLTKNQKPDGGWGFTPDDDSDVTITAMVLRTLSANKNTTLQNAINLGSQYLQNHRHADGGYGTFADSTTYETALSFMALQANNVDLAGSALLTQSFLATGQQSDGSWNHDPYETALVMRVLTHILANLTGNGQDIVIAPSMPKEGQLTGITATIRNTGCLVADNVRVRFFNGDPLAGGVQIGTDQMIASLGAGQQADVSITCSFTRMGEKTVFVQVDPENTVPEFNENDNIFSKKLWIASGPDLTAATSDLRLSNAAPKPGESFIFEYDVRNIGDSPAGAFNCAVYDGNPASGGTLLYTAGMSGVPGVSKRTGTMGISLDSAGTHTLYLVIDSDNQVAEVSETNNTATIKVKVGANADAADLVITTADIHVNPAKPSAGQLVSIDVNVNNYGTKTASGATIELFDGNPASGGTLIQSTQVTLDPGQGKSMTTSWTVPSGKHTLYAVADRANAIPEISKDNNMATCALMTDMVDIAISPSDLGMTPSYPVSGNPVALTMTVHNNGIAATGAFNLRLYDGNPASGGTLLQTYAMDSIAGGGAQSRAYNFTAQSKTYQFYAVADPENQVAELTKDNNTAMKAMIIKAAGETFGADLTVIKMDVSHITTDPLTLDTTGIVDVTYQNKGDVKITTPFTVSVFEDVNRDGRYTAGVDKKLGDVTTSQQLFPNGAFIVHVPVSGKVSFLGNHLSAMADSTDAISETNEDNNTFTTGGDCEVRPVKPIQPVVKWKWRNTVSNAGVSVPPVVINLTDDNGDGKIDEKDIPSIVFGWYHGYLTALKGNTGAQLFQDKTRYTGQTPFIAAGDIDNDGFPEIIIPDYSNGISAYKYDGTLKWNNYDKILAWNASAPGGFQVDSATSSMLVIADLDGDGTPEIVMGRTVFNSDGSVRFVVPNTSSSTIGQLSGSWGGGSTVADLDLDGHMEIVGGNAAYRSNGTLYWRNQTPGVTDGLNAVGNLDDDPYPEIVLVTAQVIASDPNAPKNGRVYVLNHDGTVKWGPVFLEKLPYVSQKEGLGGPPVIADFDGDGEPEIGVKGLDYYYILDKNGNLKNKLSIPYQSDGFYSAPTVFDLNGDGRPEVLIHSDRYFRIFDGKEGTLLFQDQFGSAFNSFQNVIIADVDGDGHAEAIVVGTNHISGNDDIRVYGSANNDWVNTRRIWSGAHYHVSNINDNGSIPKNEEPSWLTHNTYRCQKRVGDLTNPYLTPNLTASYLRADDGTNGQTLTVRVGNGGAVQVPPGVGVNFYNGAVSPGTLIGTASTTKPLVPGDYQDVQYVWASAPASNTTLIAVVDPSGSINECKEDDNIVQLGCTVPLHLPDLSIVTEDITLPDGFIREGDVAKVSATIRNKGAGTASNITVNLYDGNPVNGGKVVGETQVIPAMDPSSSQGVTFSINTMGFPAQSVFYVVVDANNTITEEDETNNSAPFTLNVYEAELPNLTVETKDIVINPSSTEPGQAVSVNAVIHNRGVAVGGIPVSFYLKSDAIGKVLIEERTIYQDIEHGGSAAVQTAFETTNLSGPYTVSVEIDPKNTIVESNKLDNIAEANFSVKALNLTASLTTDKTLYMTNENVAISLGLLNERSVSRNLTVDVTVMKPDGTVVGTVLKDAPITVDQNGNKSVDSTWNTLGTLQGDHKVVAVIKENGYTARYLSRNFVIGADKSFGLKITSNKMEYKVNENVTLSSTLTSKTANYIFTDLKAVVEITKPDQSQALSKEKTIASLLPNASQSWNTLWNTSTSAPGTYTAMVKLYSGTTQLGSAQTTFTVKSSAVTGQGLTGTVSFSPSSVSAGQSTTMAYTVKNLGNAQVNGVSIRARIMNLKTSAMVKEYLNTTDIAAGASYSASALFNTSGLSSGTYMVIVQAESANFSAPVTLASATLKISAPLDPCARATDGLLGLYRFMEGSGSIINDTSSVGSPLNFNIDDIYRMTWIKNGGISTYVDTPILSQGEASKILSSWKSSGNDMTVELWVRPAMNDLNIPAGTSTPLFRVMNNDIAVLTLSQHHSGSSPDAFMVNMNDGAHSVQFTAPSGYLTPSLTHLVFTHDAYGNARLYVNGAQVASAKTTFDLTGVSVSNSYISLNETAPAWEGDYLLMGLYGKALSSDEIHQNLNACPPAPAVRIPHRPVAVAGGPYMAYVNETISVNGNQSFDIDDGQSENNQAPYDSLTTYAWEQNMIKPYSFTAASGVQAVLPGYAKRGVYTIALQVQDNSKIAYPNYATENLIGLNFAQVNIYEKSNAAFFVKPTVTGCYLSWYPTSSYTSASVYQIYRSEIGPNGKFDCIGSTTNKTTQYTDTKIQMNKNYWYRIYMVINGIPYITKAVNVCVK